MAKHGVVVGFEYRSQRRLAHGRLAFCWPVWGGQDGGQHRAIGTVRNGRIPKNQSPEPEYGSMRLTIAGLWAQAWRAITQITPRTPGWPTPNVNQTFGDDFDQKTMPYYGPSAIEWIVGKRPKIVVSDIYEKHGDLQGIFTELFRNRISCVCLPANLDQIRETYPKCCIIPLRIRGVTQLPCRIFVVE